MSATNYRAPARCTDSTCRATETPAFITERLNPTTRRRQAEYRCDSCGLVHVVRDGTGADAPKPAKSKKTGATSLVVVALLAAVAGLGSLLSLVAARVFVLVALLLGALLGTPAIALASEVAASVPLATLAPFDWSDALLLPLVAGALADIPANLSSWLRDWTGARFVVGARASLDFASIAAGLQERLTIAAVGAALGDFVQVAPETDLTAGLEVTAWVSAADVVTVCLSNNTAGAIDQAATVFQASVTRAARR